MRVLISLAAFILVFLVGAKTEWISVSNATQITSNGAAREETSAGEEALADRAYEALVLGQTRPDATSGELIDAAVTRGEISSEQALLYGVYLACGDPRLPEQFRGHERTAPAKNILWEADVDWTSLSPDIQQALHALFTTAQPGLRCASDIARLKGDASVWWVRSTQFNALQGRDAPVQVATN